MKLRITFDDCMAKDEKHDRVTLVPRVGESVYTEQRGSRIVLKVSFYYQDDEVVLYV